MLDYIFDYTKLIRLIEEKYGTQNNFAKYIGLGRVSLNQRLNNHLQFKGKEIVKIAELLGIPKEKIPEYFFTEIVQKHEQIVPRHPRGIG